MKTKLLICLLGLTMCGSAFADIADRKAFCEERGGVYVEKTQACVPENPCESDDPEIQMVYCAKPVQLCGVDMNKVWARYAREVLKSELKTVKYIKPKSGMITGDYAALSTTDGNYIVVPTFAGPLKLSVANVAFWAYGIEDKYPWSDVRDDRFLVGRAISLKSSKDEETKCRDIADFASLLLGDFVSFSYGTRANVEKFGTDLNCILLISNK